MFCFSILGVSQEQTGLYTEEAKVSSMCSIIINDYNMRNTYVLIEKPIYIYPERFVLRF